MKSVYPVVILFLCCWLTQGCNHREVYNVADYGAKGDGIFMNTAAIQKAIDVASERGGQVLVPEGIYLTGALNLRSNVDLHITENAVLKGSDNPEDYFTVKPMAVITARNQRNISITGKGVIDGQGRKFVKELFKRLIAGTMEDAEWEKKRPQEKNRHNILYINNCDSVRVKQVTLKDASGWVQNYVNCRDITIDSVQVESVAYWNNDGVDLVDCERATITNCYINASDDAVCLKSENSDRGCKDIYIDNCTLRSSASAFKIGTASLGHCKNITVKNLTVLDTYRSAVAIESVDGGIVEDVKVSNVTGKNTGNAIFIRLGKRNKDTVFAQLRNVHIANMRIEVPEGKPDAGYETEGPVLKYPQGFKPVPGKLVSVSPHNHSSIDPGAIRYEHNVFPSSIAGLPGYPVENVTLENIEIIYAGGASREKAYFPLDSLAVITEATSSYPEFSMFGELPAWGFYVRHAKNIKWKNITLRFLKKDFRTPVIFDDVKGLDLDGVDVVTVASAPAIVLKDVEDDVLTNIKMPFGFETGLLRWKSN
ncbi:MAG: glycosyl hydrolase family 28 protein [Chitinophagaceae bacterium]|nr:glycosyl hydrolase family 28 protein [Chitinophagaceae bacterium]